MDKATTALIATEDNAAAIRALAKSLREQIDKNTEAIEQLKAGVGGAPHRLLTSAVNLVVSTFGNLTSDGTQGVIMTFDETSKRTITFAGKSVGTLASPAMFVLPEGKGSLTVSGTGTVKALFLSGTTVTTK